MLFEEAQLLDLSNAQTRDIELPLSVAHDASFSRDGHFLAVTLEGPPDPRGLCEYEPQELALAKTASTSWLAQ